MTKLIPHLCQVVNKGQFLTENCPNFTAILTEFAGFYRISETFHHHYFRVFTEKSLTKIMEDFWVSTVLILKVLLQRSKLVLVQSRSRKVK